MEMPEKQLAAMVHRLIKISEKDIPLDATDALAVAICHHFQKQTGWFRTSLYQLERFYC